MTTEKQKELADIKQEVGLEDVSSANAEDALFGGSGAVEAVAATSDGFDEFAGVSLTDERDRLRDLMDATFSRAEIEHGLALNAAVILEDPTKLFESMKAIDTALADAGLELQVVDWQTASGIVGQFIWVIRFFLYFAIFIIFLVALVIINNSMVMATMERVTEIGTMRALGAQKRTVLVMFLLETIVLGLIAGVAGSLLGAAAIQAMAAQGIPATHDVLVFLFGGPRLYPDFGLSNLLNAVLVITVVSIISTAYPARVATQIQPVTAMQAKE